jgi:uncharacterized protein VirK/YbjX
LILQKVNTVVWLVLSSGLIFAGFSPRMLRWRMRFVIAGLAAMTRVNSILHEAAHRPFRRAVYERPHILGILVWPYVDSRWSFEDKVKAIHAHFDSLDGPRRLLDFPTDSSVELTRFPEVNAELSLVLDKPMSAVREGQVTLNLFHGDQRIYTCAFTLGRQNGERVAYVGAIQGVSDPSSLELYKVLTKQFHGMRPRDLLVELMKACCVAMEIDRVLFVADRYRHHRSSYFRQRDDLHTSYDEVWKDRGAVEGADGFFEASAQPTRKAIEEVSSSKRALYRKRYALLDDVAERLHKPFREAAERPPRESTLSSIQREREPLEA